MKNLFSIGEVAKIKDITIKALRYYHKMGILIPRYIDETTGYRYYSIDQFIHIDIIKSCRELRTSIVELQEIFKDCDTDQLLQFLQLKRYEAEENIKKMQEVIKTIDSLNMKVETSKDILNSDEISIQFFEPRYVIVAPCKEVGSLQELLYYSDLEKIIQDKEGKMSMERGIIYNFNSEGDAEPKYVFSRFQGDSNIEAEQNIKILPKGKYVTLSYSKENEEERRRKLVKYVKENNLKIKSVIEVELLNDFFNTESYSCQIQMLIQN
ncbi:MerR family transcriptional regulator [Bacillus pseudomycoides]|uniref:MerR family DNA-binding transcriptional regulator n=1 Tax=Bacillus pseudomycoides TaxID=64104 RepID=A0AAJ3R8U4_9BACI|nr:helix-turn-helix domain-containing protein [Bacillus pseudomycoides]EEM06614.1 Transcriptional regulator, merR family [Bacillus pseudomycoides]EEM12428.1 Transcriptional regulator, merR family [Bacillus pseudomycoides]KFN14787.1 merR regulatory family protein [Bacillus pseudomycoides]MBD5797220.1 MerR family transcriptional regulator [Bacillus pseudomycoides]MDR4187349.1 MerR family DNA-binding transcriptional regulator [Bacillus pseudomycoides]